MRRFTTKVFALFLMVMICFGQLGFYADAAKKESEEDTRVNLLETEESASDKASVPENTGAAYNLTGMSGSPDITAESSIVLDARSGEVIYAKKAEEIRYPASITKVMTTLLAIENCKMDEIVEFSREAVYGIEAGSSTAGINVGAKITMEDTLYALMLASANEAGAAIAEHVSGSNDAFAELMTNRAKELGCTNTNFKNPHGLPDEEHYTTAHDMGLILKEAIKHKEFRKIAGTITYTIKSSTLTDNKIELWNHAKILRKNTEYYYKYAKGAKTGYTMAASNTLVTYAEKNGVQLLCVILKDYGADQSYYDTIHLYDWAFEQVKSFKPLKDYDLTGAIESMEGVKKSEIQTYLDLKPTFNENYPLLVKKGFDTKKIKRKFRLDEDFDTGRLGFIDVMSGDKVILSSPVTYDKNSREALNHITDQGGGDDLQTAKPTANKNSLLRKIVVFLLRLIVASALILVIMSMIRRWQLEKKRQARIKERMNRYNRPGGNSYRKNGNAGNRGSGKAQPSGQSDGQNIGKSSPPMNPDDKLDYLRSRRKNPSDQ